MHWCPEGRRSIMDRMRGGELVAERFAVEEARGTGGMAQVFRARDTASGATVALKVLHVSGRWQVEHFEDEAALLAALDHPGIVRHVAHGRMGDGRPYLALEWLDGETLGERLQRGPLPVADAMAVAAQVADALGAAHTAGVVHRDIKPSNIFLVGGALDRIKVLDFGVARFGSGPGRTLSGVTVGTPGYMAPEQARGARELDGRADLFSLGCVLFECLTGRPAFAGDHIMAVLAKILLEEAPRPRELVPDLPAAVDDLVLRLLAKDPAARPGDARAVAAELRTPLARSEGAGEPRPAGEGPARSLTSGEQRLLSVVVAEGPTAAGRTAGADPTMSAADVPARMAALDQAMSDLGAHLEHLVGGALVVTLQSRGAATDQAAQAARCALAMRAHLGDAPIALATGRGLVAGRWPVGDAIDRAVRKLRLAGSGIRIDEVTAGLLDDRFDVRAGDGRFTLVGEREPGTTGQRRTVLGRTTPFVGRDAELAVLTSIYRQCADDRAARAALVVGEAGAGKTRLRTELTRWINASGEPVALWLARGDLTLARSPFGMLGQLVRRAAGIDRGQPPAAQRERLHAHLSTRLRGDDLARVVDFLAELLGLPAAAEGEAMRVARRDPTVMGDQMRRAFEDWLVAESTDRPVVLVLEDLHLADLSTIKYVDAALRNLRDQPLLVLALARPEVDGIFPELWAGRNLTVLRLPGLSRRAAEQLVRAALGDAATAQTVAAVVDRAGGNPFFIEELVRAVAGGRTDMLPGTVLAMVQARLEDLPPETRRVLRAASVLGGVFRASGVAALLGGAAGDLDARLHELTERELVTRGPAGSGHGEREYVLRSALVREAAYASLTDADRALGHRLAAGWLEAQGECDPGVLAGHFERGGEPARALAWYRLAAEQAFRGSDLAAAIGWAEKAVACGAAGQVLGGLRFIQAESHRWRGEHADAERRGLEAIAELTRASPDWYSAAGEMATAFGKLGNHVRLDAIAAELLALAPQADAGWAVAAAKTIVQLSHAGSYPTADHLLSLMESWAAGAALTPGISAWLDRARATRPSGGSAVEFLRLTAAAAESFIAAGDLRSACLQRANQGFATLELGLYEQAEAALRDALATAERLGVHHIAATARQNLGLVRARMGDLDEGLAMQEAAAAEFHGHGDRRMEAGSRVYLAEIHMARNDLPAAEREASAAVTASGAAVPLRTQALGMLAWVQLAAGNPVAARETADQAMRLLESIGSIEEGEPLVRLAHAESLRATGDATAAATAIAAARDRLLERAAGLTDDAWRRAFLERIPEHARILSLASSWH